MTHQELSDGCPDQGRRDEGSANGFLSGTLVQRSAIWSTDCATGNYYIAASEILAQMDDLLTLQQSFCLVEAFVSKLFQIFSTVIYHVK